MTTFAIERSAHMTADLTAVLRGCNDHKYLLPSDGTARTPGRRSCRFFASAALTEQAGFKPQIRQLLARLAADETAVFQDEVDVHLNPKIGSCWMPRGQQPTVVTPGNNEKRHLAGSLHWRTGGLLASPPERRL